MNLEDYLLGTPYRAYCYAYPHKTAYRRLSMPMPLREVWAGERRDALFLYVHVPFCEMRCGFCNLFTTANPKGDVPALYLATLRREARRAAAALAPAQFARVAVGGGTPTYLSVGGLHALFDVVEVDMGVDLFRIPVSVEVSPMTATLSRLQFLRGRGVDRVSMGVQSFIEAESAAAGRSQRTADVERALDAIRRCGFPTLNIDLIYGISGQTVERWLASLRAALRYQPEELFLYPLYVRPLTGLDRWGQAVGPAAWDAQRLACYRAGRALLLSEGYTQVSMRMFRAAHAPPQAGPRYCCQEDGMVGLGCGARSYTRSLHYSREYAVSAQGVRSILHDYLGRQDAAFDVAQYGCVLNDDEQRRRFVIQSLLQVEGLDFAAYRQRFASDAFDDLPALAELARCGVALLDDARLALTEAGVERSDAIGPWLYSSAVSQSMEAYELR